MNNYFYCYSKNLHLFLGAFNYRYISKGIHPNTNQMYWQYEKSDKLDALIEKWNELKGRYL